MELNTKVITNLISKCGCKHRVSGTGNSHYSRIYLLESDGITQFGRVTMYDGVYSHTKYYYSSAPEGFIDDFHNAIDEIRDMSPEEKPKIKQIKLNGTKMDYTSNFVNDVHEEVREKLSR